MSFYQEREVFGSKFSGNPAKELTNAHERGHKELEKRNKKN